MKQLLLITAFLLSAFAPDTEARTRSGRRVPLMPSRYRAVTYRETPSARYETRVYRRKEPTKFGLELGFLGRRNGTEGDTLGMQWMKGGRLVMDWHWTSRWHLKPSFGYFTRVDGESKSSVTEHNFELGLSALYDMFPDRKSTVLVGGAARVDGLISSITILDSGDTVPLTFRYRMGPQANFLFHITGDTYFTLNVEAPFEFLDIRMFGGATFGLTTSF